MKYMGSKRELIEDIRELIISNYSGDGAVLDLFAGTCGVGMALRDIAPIYSNDVQSYSGLIAEGVLGVRLPPMQQNEIWSLLAKKYEHNFDALASIIPTQLEASRKYIGNLTWNEDSRLEYIKFMDDISNHVLKNSTTNLELVALRNGYFERSEKNNQLFPYLQTTYLFSEMYFSTEQAIAIDSLIYAINSLRGSYSSLKKPLMAALIHAYSYSSAGTGHFAQFRDMSTLDSVKDVFHYRKHSVIDYFLRKAEEIIKASQNNKFPEENEAHQEDYEKLLNDSTVMKKIGMIYADPPYSFVHYSRFYHAIENLARYDYPVVEHKGRYRGDRHQSPFCIKTKASGAFERMFEASYRHKKPILVSYSNTGMITLENLVDIAERIGFSVSTLEINHKHSTMGRLKDKSRDVKEALVMCLID